MEDGHAASLPRPRRGAHGIGCWPVSPRLYLFVQSLALAVLATWPLLAHPGTAAIGSPESDTIKHLWTLWWMKAQVLSGGGLHTTLVNVPEGMRLFPIEPLNGLLSLLLPFGAVATSNILAVTHLVLTGLCGGWLGKLVTGSDRGARVAAALLQGSAFVAFTLHVGVGELRQVWWLPLGLGCLLRAHETLRWRWFLALAGVLAGSVISCFYHGLFLAIAVSVVALLTLRLRWRLWVGYALAAGLALAVVLPVVHAFSASFGQGRPQEVFGSRGDVRLDYRLEAAHLDDLVRWQTPSAEPEARQERAYSGGRYLGILACILALMGVVAAPRKSLPWVAVGVSGALLAFGSVLWLGEETVKVGGHALRLPFAWLNQALAQYAEPLHFPARFLVLSSVAVSVLGALASRWRWAIWVVPLALADIAVHDLAVWPRRTVTLPDMRGIDDAALRAAGIEGALADLSLAAESNEETRTLAVAAQLTTGRATQAVPIERLDAWAPQGNDWLRVRPIARLGNLARPGVVLPGPDEVSLDLEALAERGFGGILLTHRDSTPDSRTDRLLTSFCGSPLRAAHATVWKLPGR